MGFKNLAELKAYQAARAFKLEVYRLVKASPGANGDLRYKGQLLEACASAEMNIVEGFRRYTSRQFVHFLQIARGSVGEAAARVQDGIDRGHFAVPDCTRALELAEETGRLTTALIKSLKPFVSAPPPDRTGPPAGSGRKGR